MINKVYRNPKELNVKIEVEVVDHIEISPEKVAEVIWIMDDEQQVRLLNRLAMIVDFGSLVMQLQSVTDGELSIEARNLMEMVGNYAK